MYVSVRSSYFVGSIARCEVVLLGVLSRGVAGVQVACWVLGVGDWLASWLRACLFFALAPFCNSFFLANAVFLAQPPTRSHSTSMNKSHLLLASYSILPGVLPWYLCTSMYLRVESHTPMSFIRQSSVALTRERERIPTRPVHRIDSRGGQTQQQTSFHYFMFSLLVVVVLVSI
jgi:hypothetical protein